MDRKDLLKRYRVTNGNDFKLDRYDTSDTADFESKRDVAEWMERGLKHLSDLQARLYAEGRWAVLAVLQAMDAAGKDSTIKHVMSGVNPQGCDVTSFKVPSSTELAHDFLWRTNAAMPARGTIGIFNRSYYEEVLVTKVHPEILQKQRLPESVMGKKFWEHRYEDISCMERHLARSGTAICKFFLHVSRAEQKKRFLSRLDEPNKNWKFELGDLTERQHWDDYQKAYEQAIRATATDFAPWYIVPADHKWFMRLVVAEALIETLDQLDPQYPSVTTEQQAELKTAKKRLAEEK